MNTRKRGNQGNTGNESPFKRQKGNQNPSFRKRETEEDWATFPLCPDCKMKHPREEDDVCWYLYPEQAKPFFNKAKAALRLKEFRKKNSSWLYNLLDLFYMKLAPNRINSELKRVLNQ